MVHQTPCKSVSEHVELLMSDPSVDFPRLPDFVVLCLMEWNEERKVADALAAEPFTGCGNDWAPGEIAEAWGK